MPANEWVPITVTEEDIAEKAKEHKVFVVDCWATWCAPCKTMSLYIEKLAKEYKDEVVFGKLDIEENRKAAKKYGITSVPTLLLFYEGKFSDIILGAMEPDYIKGIIEDMRKRAKEG
jgi:thioredoxin 1